MKPFALLAASAVLTIAGIGIAAADDPYPVQSQAEAIDHERDRSGDFNAIQPDPYYYGSNRGTRANGKPDAYDRSNDLPQTVIYGQTPPAAEDEAVEVDKSRQDSNAEAYDRGRADQAREDSEYP